MIYLVLKHAHSIFRWLVLAGMVFIILRSALFLVKPWKEGTSGKKLVSLALSALHIQVLLGIILYFISPKVIFSAASMSNHLLRFYLVEHIFLMIIAAALITFGIVYSKKTTTPNKQHIRLLIFTLAGLFIIFFSIPWPWRHLAGGWF